MQYLNLWLQTREFPIRSVKPVAAVIQVKFPDAAYPTRES